MRKVLHCVLCAEHKRGSAFANLGVNNDERDRREEHQRKKKKISAENKPKTTKPFRSPALKSKKGESEGAHTLPRGYTTTDPNTLKDTNELCTRKLSKEMSSQQDQPPSNPGVPPTKCPGRIELKTCAVGGHLLGRGKQVQAELAKEYPDATIEHKTGHLFQFSVKKDDTEVVGTTCWDGFTTLGRMVCCCGSPRRVADRVVECPTNVQEDTDKIAEKN